MKIYLLKSWKMIKENKTYSIKTSWVQDSKGSFIDRKEFSDYTQKEINGASKIAERITYNFTNDVGC